MKETRISFSFPITQENTTKTIEKLELPKHTKYVKGIQLTSDYPDKLYYRGTQRIEIGGEELFPNDFESKLLMSSLSVAPRERFFDLGEVAPGDLSVKIRFTDTPHTATVFDKGYTITATLLIQE